MKKSQNAFSIACLIAIVGLTALPSYGAHPLITDDAGTQGKGKFQIEVNSEFGTDEETEAGVLIEEKFLEVSSILSYGVSANTDIVLGVPFIQAEAKEDGVIVFDESGMSDASLEMKWRFYEAGTTCLALKPGITFPTGDEEKELGTGKYDLGVFLIGTHEAGLWVFHLNVGYLRNNNRLDEEENLWHLSLASEWEASEAARIVVNTGIENNRVSASVTKPVFFLAGLIFTVSEKLDIDLGYKIGLTDTETDETFLAGLAWRF